jgi:hypothetical protein
MFDTAECSWSHTSIKMLGRTLTGLRGFSFKKGIEKEHLYAAGSDPVDIQSGNKKPEGSLKVLKFELDLLNDAAQDAGYEDIAEVPHTLITITCAYKKRPTDPIRIVEAQGVAFTDLEIAMEQNAKMTEVSLPFLSMKNTVRKGQ